MNFWLVNNHRSLNKDGTIAKPFMIIHTHTYIKFSITSPFNSISFNKNFHQVVKSISGIFNNNNNNNNALSH